MQEESLKADEVPCPGHSCERTFELTKTLICKWQILTRNSARGSARVKKGKFIIRSKMIQPWLDLYNKAIQRDRQTHWFSFINICYAKSPSDLWNVCSHHCGYVSKSESFWTNRLVQSDYRLHTATPWYFYIRKYVNLQEKTRNWWRCKTLRERTLHLWGTKETESLTKETETAVCKEKAQLYKEFPWDSK